MQRRSFLMLTAVVAGALAGCGGEAAHISAGALEPDPQTLAASSAHQDPANAGMMDATPPAGRRRAD